MGDVEGLLRRALAPVDPPEDLVTRLRGALQSISELAAGELDGWELSAMRDPRRWARPAVAALAGSVAGGGLVLLSLRRRGRERIEPLGARHDTEPAEPAAAEPRPSAQPPPAGE
jgi:hypothetical protein